MSSSIVVIQMYVKHTKSYPHVHDCRLTTWTWATYQEAHNWRKQSPSLNNQKQTGMGPHKPFSPTCARMLTDMHGLMWILCMSPKVHECKNPVTSRRNNFAVFFPAWSSFLWIVSSLTKTLSLGLILVTFFRDYSASVFLYIVIQVQCLISSRPLNSQSSAWSSIP